MQLKLSLDRRDKLKSVTKSASITKPEETSFWSMPTKFYSGLIITIGLDFIGYHCHPLYRAVIRFQLRFSRLRLRFKPSSQRLSNAVAFWNSLVLYDEKASWSIFLPILENLSLKKRVWLAEWIFYLYWANERFDEAREVCDYWQDSAYSWIKEHENDARKSLYLLRKLGGWKPGYRESTKANSDTAFEIRKQSTKLDGGLVTQYRNAKLAGLILDWLQERNYLPVQQFLRSHKLNKNPPFPPRFYFSHDFGYEMTQEMGMDENTFLNLCRKAEPFSNS